MMIDAFCDDWIEQLNGLIRPGVQPCLLLDGAFHPDILALIKRWPVPVPDHLALFFNTPGATAETMAASPWVLPYPPAHPAMPGLLKSCSALPMVSLIQTPESLEQLAQRLARWCVVQCGDMVFNFRFPDTRRLPRILAVLTDEQRQSMVGPALSWHSMGRDGQWRALDIASGPAGSGAAPTPDASLNDEQFAALVQDSEADEIMALLMPDLPAEALAHQPSVRYAATQDALAFADACQFVEPSDRVDLCARVLMAPADLQVLQHLQDKYKRQPGLSASDLLAD
jgi:hypothetical protein